MPTRRLPDNPSLEHLKNQARSLQQRVRSGEPDALAQVREFDPRTDADGNSSGEFSLTTAQLVVARSYGFVGWQRLRDYVDVIREYARWPEPATALPNGQDDSRSAADRFLSLACLTYTRDGQQNQRQATELLAAHPELATASIHTMAAVGEVDALRRLLAEDPSRAGDAGRPVRLGTAALRGVLQDRRDGTWAVCDRGGSAAAGGRRGPERGVPLAGTFLAVHGPHRCVRRW